jgi:hypothetical protein
MSIITSPTHSSIGGFCFKVDYINQLNFKEDCVKVLTELEQLSAGSGGGML